MMDINGWKFNLPDFLNKLRYEANTLPGPTHTFHALHLTRPEDVKVILLGQDPYHSVDIYGTPKAYGLCFGINPAWEGKRLYSSFGNIIQEAKDCGHLIRPEDFTLEHWAKQGVLMLNTQLSVEISKPLSHQGMWNMVIESIVSQIPNRNIVWLAWGNEAYKTAAVLKADTDVIVYTSHPCKYSNTRGKSPFTGSRCFIKVNQILAELGHDTINWGSAEQKK